MQVGFMMKKALGELFILKSTKPLPIIFKSYYECSTSYLCRRKFLRSLWLAQVTVVTYSSKTSNNNSKCKPHLSHRVFQISLPNVCVFGTEKYTHFESSFQRFQIDYVLHHVHVVHHW